MPTQAIVTLENLRCISDGVGRSEPYVWPFLQVVTLNSIETIPKAAILSDSRSVIKSEMHVGETAPIPFPGNTLSGTFGDDQTNRHLILVVALWKKDDTPLAAVQAGYQAYLDELHAALDLATLLRLSQASEEEQGEIINTIKTRVYNKVYSAIEGGLSDWEKAKLFLGSLNLDDFMEVDFRDFAEPASTSFALRFKGTASDVITEGAPVTGPISVAYEFEYEIQGNLKVQPVTVDRCQAEIDAVNAAEAVVQGLQGMIRVLQSQLQHATPQQKQIGRAHV